jgi:hypothetical protein
MILMWLRSAPTMYGSLALLCALPFLSSCSVGSDILHAYIGECDSLKSDRLHGTYTTGWDPAYCDRKDNERVAEARKIVQAADQQKAQLDREKLAEARRLVKEADQPIDPGEPK